MFYIKLYLTSVNVVYEQMANKLVLLDKKQLYLHKIKVNEFIINYLGKVKILKKKLTFNII